MEQHTFTSAYNRLKEIHGLLATKQMVDVDALLSLQNEAKELHDFLLNHLHSVSKDIDEQTSDMAK